MNCNAFWGCVTFDANAQYNFKSTEALIFNGQDSGSGKRSDSQLVSDLFKFLFSCLVTVVVFEGRSTFAVHIGIPGFTHPQSAVRFHTLPSVIAAMGRKSLGSYVKNYMLQ